MMTVQAGAARTIIHDDLDAAVEAIGDVERAGRQALGELRHLLGVLRPDAEGDDLGPQPGLADIPLLAEELRNTGAEVTMAMAPVPAGLSAAVELSRLPDRAGVGHQHHQTRGTQPHPPRSPSASTVTISCWRSPTPSTTRWLLVSRHPGTASPACANAPRSSAAPSPPDRCAPTAFASKPASRSNRGGHDHPCRRRRRPSARASRLRPDARSPSPTSRSLPRPATVSKRSTPSASTGPTSS